MKNNEKMLVFEKEGLNKAITTLSGAGLKMYMYLSQTQLGPVELDTEKCIEWGIDKRTFKEGIRELERFGYLKNNEFQNYI